MCEDLSTKDESIVLKAAKCIGIRNSIGNPRLINARHHISCLYEPINIPKPNEVVSKFHLQPLMFSNLVSILQPLFPEVFYRLDNIEKDFNDMSEKSSKNLLADLTDIESLPV